MSTQPPPATLSIEVDTRRFQEAMSRLTVALAAMFDSTQRAIVSGAAYEAAAKARAGRGDDPGPHARPADPGRSRTREKTPLAQGENGPAGSLLCAAVRTRVCLGQVVAGRCRPERLPGAAGPPWTPRRRPWRGRRQPHAPGWLAAARPPAAARAAAPWRAAGRGPARMPPGSPWS